MKKVNGWWLPDDDKHIAEKIKEDTRMNRGAGFQTEQRDYSLALAAKFSKRRSGDVEKLVAETNKMLRHFDWKPKHNNLNEIINSSIKWEEKINESNA